MPSKRKHKSSKADRLLVVSAVLLGVGLIAIILQRHVTLRSSNQPSAPHLTPRLEIAQSLPSTSAKMMCTPKTQNEITKDVGIKPTNISTPSWDKASHIYSCGYLYENDAKITLSVKEMSSVAETDAYFSALGVQLGRTQQLTIGQDAYSTHNGSVVVRKDYKVLLVDVSSLPEHFGSPMGSSSPPNRGSDAVTIAETILGCWSGE